MRGSPDPETPLQGIEFGPENLRISLVTFWETSKNQDQAQAAQHEQLSVDHSTKTEGDAIQTDSPGQATERKMTMGLRTAIKEEIDQTSQSPDPEVPREEVAQKPFGPSTGSGAPPALEKESAPKKGSKVWDYPHYDPKIHGGKDDEAEEGPFSRVIEDVDKSGEISAHRGVSSHGPATEHPAGDGIDDTEREKGTGNEEEEGSASDGGDRDRQSHGGHHQQR
ncbi:MAG: hypothetical protein L6R39_005606 [Caloplaca ligustica]|nr:MAG: hypothetical protein L6R39_005606 [Caloplaca ligustica]